MNDKMRVLRIIEGTSVDGPGLRTSVYFAGCAHKCQGCHNESSWDFAAGSDMTVDEIMSIIDYNDFNVTFSGGDPIYQAPAIIALAKKIKETGRSVWCYTGFTFEELLSDGPDGARELLSYIDVLVDGPYIANLRKDGLRFRGSTNQRFIDVKATLKSGLPVELEEYYKPAI